jgi:hypothetical protein
VTCSLAALGVACILSPASAWAVSAKPADGDLSPRLADLATPTVRAAPPQKQARKLSLAPSGPGSLLREGSRVIVEVRFERGAAAAIDDLRAAGAKVLGVSPRYQTATIAAKPGELRRLSRVPGARGASEVLVPFTAAPACPSGTIVSEGDEQLRADEVHVAPFELVGAGVKVGILSDSFNRDELAETSEAEDVANGDLPGVANPCGDVTPVELLDDSEAQGEDEGRAMGQIVHDLAPGASLAYASAFTGLLNFAKNIKDLRDAGASVIVDDVAYPTEPFFQEGPVGVSVREVVESGVTYFSSAANSNLFDPVGNEIGSWEAAQYRDSGGCPPAIQAVPEVHGTHCQDFNPGSQTDRTLGIKVAAGATLSVDLQWAEPWNGVQTDLDAYLLSSTGGLVGAQASDNVEGSQRPIEFLQWVNESASQKTVQLVVNRYSGDSPRLKVAFLENGFGVTAIEYPRSTGTDVVGPTIFGHNGAADAISVAAVPFDDGSLVEDYSSRGPVTHYFAPVEGSEAAAALPSAEVLSKPDLAATDCGVTTFFGSEPVLEEATVAWRFCGTSAAAPHAAAVAALMADAESASPEEIRAAMLASALPVGEFGACEAGGGLIDAVGAVEALLGSAGEVDLACEPPAPEASVEESRASGDWGSEAPPSNPVEPGGEAPISVSEPPGPSSSGSTPPQAPSTFFRKHPPKVLRAAGRSAMVVFRFGSDEAGVSFLCKVDQRPFRACPQRLTRRFALGPHLLRVKARDQDGDTDETPAVFRFRVTQIAGG